MSHSRGNYIHVHLKKTLKSNKWWKVSVFEQRAEFFRHRVALAPIKTVWTWDLCVSQNNRADQSEEINPKLWGSRSCSKSGSNCSELFGAERRKASGRAQWILVILEPPPQSQPFSHRPQQLDAPLSAKRQTLFIDWFMQEKIKTKSGLTQQMLWIPDKGLFSYVRSQHWSLQQLCAKCRHLCSEKINCCTS